MYQRGRGQLIITVWMCGIAVISCAPTLTPKPITSPEREEYVPYGVKPFPVRTGFFISRSERDIDSFAIPCKGRNYYIEREGPFADSIENSIRLAIDQVVPKSSYTFQHPGLSPDAKQQDISNDLTVELTFPHVTVTQTACEFTRWWLTLFPLYWVFGWWEGLAPIGELHTATVQTHWSFHGTVKDRNGHKLFDRDYSESQILLAPAPPAQGWGPVTKVYHLDHELGPALSKSFRTLLGGFVFDITDSAAIRAYVKGQEVGAVLAASEVDDVPLVARAPRDGAYAVIIGIEEYRFAEKASHARHDALVFAQYAQHVMGYAQNHTVVLTDGKASLSDMRKYLEEWLPNNVPENGSVLVYFAGHGVIDPKTGNGYLLPYGGDPNSIGTTGYPLARLYETVGRIRARDAILFLDTDFSGQGARSVRPKTGETHNAYVAPPASVSPTVAVLKATRGIQKSLLHPQEQHSVFTYALLKAIREHRGEAKTGGPTLQQFAHEVAQRVQETAQHAYNTDQSPELTATKGIQKQFLLRGSGELVP